MHPRIPLTHGIDVAAVDDFNGAADDRIRIELALPVEDQNLLHP